MVRKITALILLVGLATGTATAFAIPEGYLPIQAGPESPATWTVARGDHFWSIAREHLAEADGKVPEANELAAYWRELVTANLGVIRSGDADLIYPGEVVTLP